METRNYNVAIAYRIYPKISKVSAVFPNDKFKLSELCLKSFKESLGNLKAKIFVILDDCPPEYKLLFKKYFNEVDLEFIEVPGLGNGNTFNMQMDILLKQNFNDYIFFAEDDYFYLPDTFSEMITLMKNKNVDFVTPYDHLDIYTLKLHDYKSKIIISEKRHWRTIGSTCMTFLTTKDTLKKTKRVFDSYKKNNSDAGLWMSLTKIKIFSVPAIFSDLFKDKLVFRIIVKAWKFSFIRILFGKKMHLYGPVPSIATHMDKQFLAPGYNWDEIFRGKISEMNII